MLDLKCHQLETQISPCIGCFLTSCTPPFGGKRCHFSAVKPSPRPYLDQILHVLPSPFLPLCAMGLDFWGLGYSLSVLICPPTASGVGVRHLQVFPASWGSLDLEALCPCGICPKHDLAMGLGWAFYGCREVGFFPLLTFPLLPGSWIRRRQAWRSWAGFRQERLQDGDSLVVAGLALCLLHLVTSVPMNPVFSPSCLFPCHLASTLQTKGPVVALTWCMLSLCCCPSIF